MLKLLGKSLNFQGVLLTYAQLSPENFSAIGKVFVKLLKFYSVDLDSKPQHKSSVRLVNFGETNASDVS